MSKILNTSGEFYFAIFGEYSIATYKMGYDFTSMFVDASNLYTFMEENDMAEKGNKKKHLYDLNQILYYIAANYDYISLYGESYAGNVHDSRTFKWTIENMPGNSILIFDRGYNSK